MRAEPFKSSEQQSLLDVILGLIHSFRHGTLPAGAKKKIQEPCQKKFEFVGDDDCSLRSSSITEHSERCTGASRHFVIDLHVKGTLSGGAPVEEQESQMIPSIGTRCVYDPATLTIMTSAFDRACDLLPVEFRKSDHMRKKVALHIIRRIDDGESDPRRLADSAVLSLVQ